ncbi:hypothetical protein ACYPKM_00715 [Pseudomonas aeruginosa]
MLSTIRPASKIDGENYTDITDTPDGFYVQDAIVKELFPELPPYGTLLAYLYRRFGEPNAKSNPTKAIACYRLSTPHPEMLLEIRISPKAGAEYFQFIITDAEKQRQAKHPGEHRQIWQQTMLEWREAEGLPSWMPEWVKLCNEVFASHFSIPTPITNWKHTAHMMTGISRSAPGHKTRTDELLKLARDFFEDMNTRYKLIRSQPAVNHRSRNWKEWSRNDSLRECADAMVETLTALKSTVPVRDMQISAFGQESTAHFPARPSQLSGQTAGVICLDNAKELKRIQKLAGIIYGGDLGSGMDYLMSNLKKDA